MKVDYEKAYDSVRWDFLFDMLFSASILLEYMALNERGGELFKRGF